MNTDRRIAETLRLLDEIKSLWAEDTLDAAKRFLADLFEEQVAWPSLEIRDRGLEAGFSFSTLFKARSEMPGFKTYRFTDKKGDSQWYWQRGPGPEDALDALEDELERETNPPDLETRLLEAIRGVLDDEPSRRTPEMEGFVEQARKHLRKALRDME